MMSSQSKEVYEITEEIEKTVTPSPYPSSKAVSSVPVYAQPYQPLPPIVYPSLPPPLPPRNSTYYYQQNTMNYQSSLYSVRFLQVM